MKTSRISIAILGILSFASVMPLSANAQGVSGLASGTASCAVGAYLTSLITSTLSSAVSDEVSTNVPVNDSSANSKLASANSKLAAEQQKNFTLDHLAACAAKQLLHQMTADTINWINTGFKGSPAFLTNPKAFLLNAADQLTGQMISGSGLLQGLCSPWNVDIRLTLALEQATNNFQTTRYTCTLSKIVAQAKKGVNVNVGVNASVTGFTDGNFSQGGWDAFADMMSGGDNPATQYLQAKSDLQAQIDANNQAVNQDLNRGSGFMSDTHCTTVQYQSGVTPNVTSDGSYISDNGNGTGSKCSVTTPGSQIAHLLNTSSDSGFVEAELANDINSVVSTLMTQLTTQLLTKGLTSLSSSGSGVSANGGSNLNSYIGQLQSSAYSQQTVSSGGQIYTIQNGNITDTGATPPEVYSQAITTLTDQKTDLANARKCLSGKQTQDQNPYDDTGSSLSDDIQQKIGAIDTDVGQIDTMLATLATEQAAAQKLTTYSDTDKSAAQTALTQATTKAQSVAQDVTGFNSYCSSI